MCIGFHLTPPFWSPATRSATQLIDEAIRLVAAASKMGFAWVSAPHHWLGHPSFFPHPFLGRAALVARRRPAPRGRRRPGDVAR